MRRKSSKDMFAAVLNQLSEGKDESVPEVRSSSPHLLKVAAGVRQMQERSEAVEKLLQAGEQIVELDPQLIRPSPIQDRYDEAYEAEAVAGLVESMRARGQVQPGLVRPVKTESVFEIVFGRRRLAAAKQLGRPFKTIIRDLTDEEAIILQGEENASHEDLSFIEKCVFARAQEEAGFRRETICASLATSKSHVSEMIAVASEIPGDLLQWIGKAPGIGRPRWAALSRKLSEQKEGAWKPLVASPDFKRLAGTERFELALTALSSKTTDRPTGDTSSWASPDKTLRVSVKSTPKRAVVTLEAPNGPKFAQYISGRLEALYEDFLKGKMAQTGD